MFTAVPWGIFAVCALLAGSGFWRMARTQGGYRDAGCWHAPLIFTSAAVALLAYLGALPPAEGAALAVLPLAPPAVIAWKPLSNAAKSMGWPRAVVFILGRFLAFPLKNALRDSWQDVRGMRGAPAPEAAPVPAPVIDRSRREPSTARPDLALGPAPVPAQVAQELESAGVAVPAAWAAVAEWIGSFEPEDEDDWRLHIAENAAGILTVAEAIGGQAEDFASGIKLDPDVTSAHTDFADDFADTSSAAARVLQAYDRAYEGINEHVDNGGTLVEDARRWHGAGGPEGAAA